MMNEQIEQLAEQATEEMDQEAFSEDMNIPAEWYQKFAELLIEEVCYDIMNVHGASPEHIALVAKHYGVEL